MAQYKKGLKSKMLNALVLMKTPKNMKELINKIIKINNRIYQKEWANKKHNRQILMQKAPQQTPNQQYKGLKPMDFNNI